MEEEYRKTKQFVGDGEVEAPVPVPEGNGWRHISTTSNGGFVIWTWARRKLRSKQVHSGVCVSRESDDEYTITLDHSAALELGGALDEPKADTAVKDMTASEKLFMSFQMMGLSPRGRR